MDDYILVGAAFLDALQLKVNKRMEEGYAPSGNIVAFDGLLVQPMVHTANVAKKTVEMFESDVFAEQEQP